MLTHWESTFGEPASEKAKWSAPVQESARKRRPHQRIRNDAAGGRGLHRHRLKSIAQAAGLPLIAYLLAMAKEEAQVERARDD